MKDKVLHSVPVMHIIAPLQSGEKRERSFREMANVNDAMTRAAKEPAFAKELLKDPAKYKQEYQLTDEQLKAIGGAMKKEGGVGGWYEG